MAYALWAATLLVYLLTGRAADAAKAIPTFAGPFIAYAEKIYLCNHINGSQPMWTGGIRHSHFNPQRPYEKQVLTGNFNVPVTFDDNYWGRVEMSSRSNNQWKENAFLFRFPSRSPGACTALRVNIPDFFRAVYHKKLGEVAYGKGPCRVPADFYTIDHEPVEWGFPNVPVMPYGHYRFSIISGMAGKLAHKLCLSIECHIIPKPPRPN